MINTNNDEELAVNMLKKYMPGFRRGIGEILKTQFDEKGYESEEEKKEIYKQLGEEFGVDVE